MRVFAISDLHVDFEDNTKWIAELSTADFTDDVLILAGDVADTLPALERTLALLAQRFRHVLFVPGNHELWVIRDRPQTSSLEKFAAVARAVTASGASMQVLRVEDLAIVPMLGWYDYSFGEPGDYLKAMWMDFRACRWPAGFSAGDVTAYLTAFNERCSIAGATSVITFSHFLPRIDLMPRGVPDATRQLYPVLGTTLLEQQLRALSSQIHVYGHSHLNRRVTIDGVTYVNNAFGYPCESHIAAKRLLCIRE